MGVNSSIAFALVLVALDLAAIAVLRQDRPAPTVTSEPPQQPGAVDDGWALCQTSFGQKPVTPTAVAITYLDPKLDDELIPSDIRRWFAGVDGIFVDVYKLELRNGRRRISLELSRGKWATWDRVAAGQQGKAVCGLVRAALIEAGIGRPVPAGGAATLSPDGDAGYDRSRHDFEFVYARRPKLYRSIEWVGTLEHVLTLDRFVELRQWLNGQ